MTTVAGARRVHTPLRIFWRAMIDGWRGLIGWILGIAAVVFLYLPLYPSMQTPQLLEVLQSLPAELVQTLGYENITTGAGYAQATFFGLIGFVLITIAGISWGAAAIAGAEESGRLELILAHAVGRVQYALESALTLLTKIVVLGAAAWSLIWLLNGPSQLGLEPANLLAATLAWMGLGLFAATAALATGAITGRRIWAIGVGAGIAVAGYVLHALANNSAELDWLRRFSPYDWAFGDAPLANGADGLGLLLLFGGSALFTAIAVVALARRDVLG